MVKLRFWSMKPRRNLVGPQIRKLRFQKNLKQEDLSAKCGVLGWDISRGTLAKVEAGIRCVTDLELWVLARALRVSLEDLYPRKIKTAKL